ncbi:33508_t:CDS:1, partial [Gigaspora margarita]
KEKIIELKPSSSLYNLIHKDICLSYYIISELENEIRNHKLFLITKIKEKIFNEKDYNLVMRYIEALKSIDNFFIKDKKNYINELEEIKQKIKIKIDNHIKSETL